MVFPHLSAAALVHAALQGSRHVKCKLESYCWDVFASQMEPGQAKAAWSRAAGIVSSLGGKREASMSAALQAFALWGLVGVWVLSLLSLFFFLSSPHPQHCSLPEQGSQSHPPSFPVTLPSHEQGGMLWSRHHSP